MCGISGIIKKDCTAVNYGEIEKVTEIIKHRGPDGSGYYFGENFAFGHRRLAIIDPSENGKQPMSFGEDYVITYNGEVYNYLELRLELTEHGYTFTNETDTEVILASYVHWGLDCVNHFNGMWSFAIYDRKKNIIFCSRDRFGVKPFYYFESQEKFTFASEIKQFTKLDGWRAKANRQRLSDFLLFEVFDHTNETLFEGVYQLQGGHSLIYNLEEHTHRVFRYYTLNRDMGKQRVSFQQATDYLQRLFVDSVRLRLRADVKLGSCLSGGLDSSSIVCTANRSLRESNQPFEQETVSSCFSIKQYDEQEYIDAVIESKGLIGHKVFPALEDLFQCLDEITWFQDEPFGSTSIFAQWSVFRTAREKQMPVMLDGQGADEQLAGYQGFYGIFLYELFRSWQWTRFIREIRELNRQGEYSLKWIIGSTFKWAAPATFMAFLKSRVFKRGPFCWIKPQPYFRQSLKNVYSYRVKSVREYSLDQLLVTSLPKLLHYEDRDSMAHSIESRVPFLDYRLVEMILNIPAGFKINDGITKYIFREAMKDVLPEKIRARKDKMGFVTPEEEWIRNNKELFEGEVSAACDILKDMVDRERVLAWYDKVTTSPGKLDFTVWRLISISRWAKVFQVTV